MRVRATKGLRGGQWVAAALTLAVAGCGGEASADGSAPRSVQVASASDLSDAEITVYKSPT